MFLEVAEDSSQPEAKEAEDIEAIEEIAALHEVLEESREQVSSLRSSLDHEKIRVQELWRVNCDKLTEFDSSLAQKDSELGILRSRLRELEGESWGAASQSSVLVENGVVSRVHQGKAPPGMYLLGKTWKSSLTIGCQLYSGFQNGTGGPWRSCCCSWLDILKAVLFRSGVF